MRAAPIERVFFVDAPELPLLQVFAVENSARLWRTYHETYAVCTCLPSVPTAAAEWRYRNRMQSTSPGGLMLIEPGELHVTTKAHGVGSFRVLLLSPSWVQGAAEELGPAGAPHFRTATSDDRRLYAPFARLHACLESPHVTALEKQTRFMHAIRALLSYTERTCVREPEPICRDGVRRAREFVEANHRRNVTLHDLAAAAGTSAFHLAHVFSRELGIAPHQYLMLVRLERARILIAEGMPLATVASETGFADQSHLTRLFARAWGVTPGRYREVAAHRRSLSRVALSQAVGAQAHKRHPS